MTLVREHADRMGYADKRRRDLVLGTAAILEWLLTHPGDGWQQRWLAAGADTDLDWLNAVPPGPQPTMRRRRERTLVGVASLLLTQVVLPSYDFLTAYNSASLFREVRKSVQPEVFDRMIRQASETSMLERRVTKGLNVLAKLVLRGGRGPAQLTGEDFEGFRQWAVRRDGRIPDGVFPAWDLLRGVDIVPRNLTYRAFLHQGQRPTAELVDRYELRCRLVRDVLVRYLEERRPGLDYGSFTGLVSQLVGGFWADIEQHHPEVDSLRLPEEVAAAWKERLKYVTKRRGRARATC
ncbi:hypothetical protein QQY24_32535 [Streptomyces sp. TG1A-8]|uniref:hypothetical protein n=1 Tax=Streptomyces sp. TG1A-8 TaxID=3051385 RepID=UPI00265BDBA8|nr:hypothetical protein [Streptomyces sp. TG1A-8]MDO0929842.1 hypothetical protein [Streptomyces sp. TG1A-8]